MTFGATVTVHGRREASASFQRKVTKVALGNQVQSLAANGFVGQFRAPPASTRRRAAVLVIGGSEGGLPGSLLLAQLAGHGWPTLGVAYFGGPGLPKTLSNIRLEYFEKALTWLAHQRGVDPQHIAVLGISRGSEAAQLLGVHYPKLVHAVIASVPSNSAICSYPGCAGPAWTLHGRALPYTRDFNDPSPDDEPSAVIPDERIRGPVFLACAGNDQTWNSCPYADAIMGLLDAHHHRWRHELHPYPKAGHLVGSLLPYEPVAPAAAGPSYADDQKAKVQLWPELLRFLDQFATTPVR